MPLPETNLAQAAQHTKDTLSTNYKKGVAGITAVALAMIGAGVYKAPSADSASLKGEQPTALTAGSLLSPQFMAKHCKIDVVVNVGSGHTPEHSSGVTVEGKDSHATIDGTPNYPVVQYNWQVSNRDKFCGIVGIWFPEDIESLQPTSETAHGGEYLDTTGHYNGVGPITPKDGIGIAAFMVYAEPKAHQ